MSIMFSLSVDLRRILTASAIALMGIFVVTVGAQALPLQILQPSWIQRMSGTIIGGVSFPLLGMVLLLLAEDAGPGEKDRPPGPETPTMTTLRRLAWFVAIGFLLMIPLQTWAGVKTTQQAIRNDVAQVKPYRRALDLIRMAETPEALINAVSTMPGVPPNVQATLNAPLPKVRQELINQLEPQIKARLNQIQAASSRRWQEGIAFWIKEAFNAAFCALAFGAMGRLGPTGPTLASGFLMPTESQRQWRRAISGRNRNQKRWPWSKPSGPGPL